MPYRILKPPPHWLDLQQVEEEADRLIAGRNLRLLFPPAVERIFNEERTARRRGQLTQMGLLTLLAYDMFLVGDYLLMPQHMARAAAVRLAVVTPAVLLGMAVLQGRKARASVMELASALLCVFACAAALYLHHGLGPAALPGAEPGVVLLLLAMNTLLRPGFLVSIAGTVCCAGMYLAWLLPAAGVSVQQRLNVGGQIFWFAGLSLLANYALSREIRFSWLLQMRGRIQRQMLAEANEELLTKSLHDPLTGIPNRAAYEKRLPELWQEAIALCEPFAAVMVDVDYFKQVNDSFGHLYGDRVLQRIASLLEQSLRAELDFVARYGGEEFVVLLPGSTLESGVQVADRIRTLVEVAGSPAVSRDEGPLPPDLKWSTVSCGVAAMTPTAQDDPRALIDAADAALYRAKHSGRNCVRTTATLSLVRSS